MGIKSFINSMEKELRLTFEELAIDLRKTKAVMYIDYKGKPLWVPLLEALVKLYRMYSRDVSTAVKHLSCQSLHSIVAKVYLKGVEDAQH